MDESQHHQEYRRTRPDGGVAGQHTHQRARDTHDHEGEDQYLLAADAIAQLPEDEGAEWTREESDAEGGERRERCEGGVLFWEKHSREHQALAVPYKMKSYHSSAVPITPALKTRRAMTSSSIVAPSSIVFDRSPSQCFVGLEKSGTRCW